MENRGQMHPQVKFYAKGSGQHIFFTRGNISLSLNRTEGGTTSEITPDLKWSRRARRPHGVPASTTVRLIPIGLQKSVKLQALEPLPGKIHYLMGSKPAKWRKNIPTYGAVVYREAYPGIDLKFYGQEQQLEYDVIVRPGADPGQVKFRVEGAQSLALSREGDLIIKLPDGGELTQKKPVIYQEIAGQRVTRQGKFTVNNRVASCTYGFKVAAYDRSRPLVIDPVLLFCTYLGGTNVDMGEGVAFDDAGNIYVAGYTYSANFPGGPLYPGTYDGFISKFSPTGQIIYTTFLGGSGQDYCLGIAVRDAHVYVTGGTDSTDFPDNAAKAGDFDAFVTKFDKDTAAPAYSIRLGGSSDDEGYAIAVNQDGGNTYAYVAGYTTPTEPGDDPFPTTAEALQANHNGGYWDGFVSKIAPNGTIAYSTFLGGSGDDEAYGIYAGEGGVVYVTGWTEPKVNRYWDPNQGIYVYYHEDDDFPITKATAYQPEPNGQEFYGPKDAFLTIFDTSPNPGDEPLIYSTYLGGNDWDYAQAVIADGTGKVYVAGMTQSTAGFPCTHNYDPSGAVFEGGSFDGFVTKFDPALSGANSLLASAYLGGGGSDRCMGVRVAQGTDGYDVYLVGDTGSSDFLGQSLRIRKGYPEVFLVKLPADWDIDASTAFIAFLKGGNIDYGRALDVRRTDDITTICVTGGTRSNDLPAANSYSGSYDAFVASFEEGGEEPEPPSPPKPPKPPKK